MSQPAARLGDLTAHGGAVTSGNPTVLIGGQPAATLDDLHVCPLCSPGPHVGGPVMVGAPTVLVGGRPAARVGDPCACAAPAPDVIVSGCPTVLIGGASGAASPGAAAAAASAAGAALRPGTPGTGAEARPLSPWVGVAYADPSGRPVAGWAYHAEGDGDERDGVVGTGGQVWCDGLAGGGAVEVGLVGVYGCRWERGEARVGEAVGVSARCAGVADGAFAAFEVYRVTEGPGGAVERALVWTRLGEVAGGRVEALEPFVEPDELVEDEATAVWYEVEAVVEHVHRARGGALRLWDDVALRVLDEEGAPVRDLPHEVRVATGEVHGLQTDGGGAAGVPDVEPGRYRVALPLSRRAGRGPNADGMGEPPGEANRFDIALYRRTSVIRTPRLSGRSYADPDATIAFRLWSDSRTFDRVDEVQIEVFSGTTLLWAETDTGDYTAPGRHFWTWEATDRSGVFDTARLREGVRVVVTARKGGTSKTDAINLRGTPIHPTTGLPARGWIDVRIDFRRQAARITLYIDCQNEGIIHHVSERGKFLPALPFSEIDRPLFERLRRLVHSGLETYWSRTGMYDVDGFSVQTAAVEERSDRALDLDLYVNDDEHGARSVNPRTIGLPIDPALIYNRGRYPNTVNGRLNAERAFRLTAAHEAGHSLVAAARGMDESLTHHGTTTRRQAASGGATAHPTSGEIDLMRYYTDARPPGVYTRTRASARDVRALLQMPEVRLVPTQRR